VEDLTIRPTAKFIILRTIVAVLLFLAVEISYYTQWQDVKELHYLPYFVPVIFLWPANGAMRRMFTKITISGDRLRWEVGALSKTTRTIQLSRLQDVTVGQTFAQRLFGVGDLSIETAGATSREAIRDVDNPHAVADEILNRAHQPGAAL
jgi:uncharacterized membrane protein YdbT with pleckstrin-like domain